MTAHDETSGPPDGMDGTLDGYTGERTVPMSVSLLTQSVPSVPMAAMDTLWFQVAGTVCNIACTHCFISCSHTNHSH